MASVMGQKFEYLSRAFKTDCVELLNKIMQ